MSDFLQAIIVLPFDVVSMQRGRFAFDDTSCTTIAFLHTFLALTSISHFTILATTRACVIWKPIQCKITLEKVGVRTCVISLGWGYALFWSMMPMLGWSGYSLEANGIICSVDWRSKTTSSKAYIYSLFFFCFVLPVASMAGAIFFIFTLKRMRMHAGNDQEQQIARSRSWKTLLVFLMSGKYLKESFPFFLNKSYPRRVCMSMYIFHVWYISQ